MITLKINNSYSQIIGLDANHHKALRQILSYEIDSQAAYFSNNHHNTRRYLIDNRGNFASGLLPLVSRYLRLNALNVSTIDDRVKPKGKLPLTGKFNHKPYRVQQEAVDNAIIQEQGTISMCTGSGKSNVIAMLIDSLKLKTLVVVPNLELKRQLTESLIEIFGDSRYITVENIDSASLATIKGYDCIIIDEAHHAAAKTYIKHNRTNWNGIYYRFFLTATPMRTKTEENILLQSIAGQVIYELPYKKAVKLGIVVPVEAYVVNLPKVKTDAYTWQEVYSELAVNNKYRNEVIAGLIKVFSSRKLSTLCLVKEIRHGENISAISGAPFVNGQDEDSRSLIGQFNARKLIALIGTEGVIGEGVDTKSTEFVIIAALGKAKGAFMQKVGRAIRTYPGKESAKVILFCDKSSKHTYSHYKAQVKILEEEYGCTPVELDYEDYV